MIKRTGKEWHSLWHASGQSKADFCRANDLPYWKLAAAGRKATEQKLVEIKLPEEKTCGLNIVCKFGGFDLRVHWQFG
jgi:hypothetical protein